MIFNLSWEGGSGKETVVYWAEGSSSGSLANLSASSFPWLLLWPLIQPILKYLFLKCCILVCMLCVIALSGKNCCNESMLDLLSESIVKFVYGAVIAQSKAALIASSSAWKIELPAESLKDCEWMKLLLS